jgi:uncharacterized protein DUF6788
VKKETNKTAHSSLQQSFLNQLQACWPALKGSLALVYKPCVRPHCATCARGEKHPNHLLAFTDQGRRRCLYVPKAMVPVLKRALQNGRRIERLLYEMGPALLREYRRENPAQTGPALKLSPAKTRSKC